MHILIIPNVFFNETHTQITFSNMELRTAIAARSVQQHHWISYSDSPQGETPSANLNPDLAIAARSAQQRHWISCSDSPQGETPSANLNSDCDRCAQRTTAPLD